MSFAYSSGVITQSNGADKSITAVADGGGGELDLSVTSHGYSAGDIVEVTGTTSYNGVYEVASSVDSNTVAVYDITIDGTQNAFGSTETGTIALGDNEQDFESYCTTNGYGTLVGTTLSATSNIKVLVNGAINFKSYGLLGFTYEPRSGSYLSFGRVVSGNGVYGCIVNINHTFDNQIGIGSTTSRGKVGIYGTTIIGSSSNRSDLGHWSAATPEFWLNGATVIRNTTAVIRFYMVDGYSWGGENRVVNLSDAIMNPNNAVLDAPYLLIDNIHNITAMSFSAYKVRDIQLGGTYTTGIWSKRKVSVVDGNIEKADCYYSRHSDGDSDSYIKKFYSVNVRVVDDSLSPVSGAKYHLEDSVGATTPDESGALGLYTGTVGASGEFGELLVYRWASYRDSQGYSLISSDTTDPVNTWVDHNPYDFGIIEYTKAIAYTASMRKYGSVGDPELLPLLPDLTLKETDKATVEAYTSLDTAPKLYDRAKSYLYDNYAGENSTLVSRSGNEIDLGSFDLDIDATATQAFAFDGSKITIHADTFTDDLVTTGIITLLNGAEHTGTRTDANGTVAPPATFTLTGLKTNSEVRIYESGTTTELAGIENSETSFSYVYDPSGDFDVDYVVFSTGYQPIRVTGFTLTDANTTIPIQQVVDRVYTNPA